MTARDEQETTISYCLADDVVRIYSCVPAHIRRMRKDEAFREVRTWGDDAAEFEISRALFDPMRGRRRPRVLTEEQREAARERGRRAQAERSRNQSPSLVSDPGGAPATDDKGASSDRPIPVTLTRSAVAS